MKYCTWCCFCRVVPYNNEKVYKEFEVGLGRLIEDDVAARPKQGRQCSFLPREQENENTTHQLELYNKGSYTILV